MKKLGKLSLNELKSEMHLVSREDAISLKGGTHSDS